MSLWSELSATAFKLGFIDAGPVRTRYLEAGSGGTPVVLLHGTSGHLEAYHRNIGPHAERHRVLALDFVGHGFSGKPDRPYVIKDYVRHVIDFCDAMRIDRFHLSGESLGGWVAAKLAADHPNRVVKLVLNTAGGLVADPKVMARLKELSMQAVVDPSREKVRARLEWLMHDKSQVTEDLVDIRYQIYTQPGFRRAMENILVLQDMDVRVRNLLTENDLAAIAAPTLVVWTDHDPTGAVTVGQRFASTIRNARLVVLKNSGHWPQYEEADAFNRLHLDFLAS